MKTKFGKKFIWLFPIVTAFIISCISVAFNVDLTPAVFASVLLFVCFVIILLYTGKIEIRKDYKNLKLGKIIAIMILNVSLGIIVYLLDGFFYSPSFIIISAVVILSIWFVSIRYLSNMLYPKKSKHKEYNISEG